MSSLFLKNHVDVGGVWLTQFMQFACSPLELSPHTLDKTEY